MKFSERTAWDLGENDFARSLRERRRAGALLADLTVSNPTECGFLYDETTLLAPLSDRRAMVYEPEALGMRRGRDAVAEYYAELGAVVQAERICLTTSTSEAYSFLFRVLCDVDDEVLIARPSYPLFEFIARLDSVRLIEYPLIYSDGWHIDVAGMESLISERTRAVVVVHPNNPTGNYCGSAERRALEELCAQRGLALIVDEVFLEYAVSSKSEPSFAAGSSNALTFVLSGLSKVCALPQMKVSWIVALGPEALVDAAVERLEVVADTFLSMNAPMQFALGPWLRGRSAMQEQIRSRMNENLRELDQQLKGTEVSRLAMQGGWVVVLRVPRGSRFVERALERGVIVQPGEFYGLGEGRVVLSLLTPPDVWQRGLERMLS